MKLLVLLPRFPFPLEKGDKLRAYNQLLVLREHFRIHLVALSDQPVLPVHFSEIEGLVESVEVIYLPKPAIGFNLFKALFSNRPFQTGYYFNRKAYGRVQEIIVREQPDHIYCQLLRTALYVKDAKIPKTLDYQDAFSKGIERRLETSSPVLKPMLQLEKERLRKMEDEAFNWFDNKTIISVPDRDCIPHPRRNEIIIVKNGVNSDYFSPAGTPKKFDLLFSGNMAYPPNVDCAVHIVKDILPLIMKQKHDVRLLIAGATPAAQVRALQSENVVVSGWMDDIRRAYNESAIFLAPMRLGSGLQNKLLEAMAMELPCITSQLTNNALEAEPGKHLFVEEDPEAIAGLVLTLLDDKELRNQIGKTARRFVTENYNWQATTRPLINLIKST